jgi:DNA-binding NarL/FixJ family response regulator
MQQVASPQHQPLYEGLNQPSVEILRLLAEGMSDREIAERLTMTVNTVKWYNRQIYNILSTSSMNICNPFSRE